MDAKIKRNKIFVQSWSICKIVSTSRGKTVTSEGESSKPPCPSHHSDRHDLLHQMYQGDKQQRLRSVGVGALSRHENWKPPETLEKTLRWQRHQRKSRLIWATSACISVNTVAPVLISWFWSLMKMLMSGKAGGEGFLASVLCVQMF